MSLTITTNSNLSAPSYLLPVYSNITVNAVETDGTVDNYLFEVWINDVSTYAYSIQKDYNNIGSLNLSTVLEGIFTTDVSINNSIYFYNTNAIKKITWKVTSRTVTLATINVNDQTATITPLYVYNGVISPDEEPIFKDPLAFFPNVLGSYWLRKHNAPIKVINYTPGNGIADEHWISTFNGNFKGSTNCLINQLTLKTYKYDGSVITTTHSISFVDKSILTINVSKTSLNSFFGAGSMDINTKYCTLQDVNKYLNPVTIIPVSQNKINNPYNILYINSLGVPECVLFDRNDEKGVTMKRNTYGYYKEKVYYVDIDRQYSVYSSLLTQEESLSLFDLWISPVVYAENDEFVVPQPVIITDTKQIIANRWNANKIIQYKLNLTCAYRTLAQKV